MRKVYVDITVKATIYADDGVEIADVITDLDCVLDYSKTDADIEDVYISDHVITDSK